MRLSPISTELFKCDILNRKKYWSHFTGRQLIAKNDTNSAFEYLIPTRASSKKLLLTLSIRACNAFKSITPSILIEDIILFRPFMWDAAGHYGRLHLFFVDTLF